jgi:hypothetical protein
MVAFHKKVRQSNYSIWFLPDKENESAHDLDSLRAITKTIVTKCSPQSGDAKLRHLTPLSESTSLSQLA